jgi:hypothetical protein
LRDGILYVRTERRWAQMTDEEFLGMQYEDSPDLGDRLAEEFGTMTVPAFTALLTRRIDGTTGGYTEGMWVHGYVDIASIVITHPRIRLACGTVFPGTVRTIPVGSKHLRTADAFRATCEAHASAYERHGWARVPHTIQGS